MSIRYERDDARRRVAVTISGAFQTDEIVAIVEQQRAEDAWSYGVFYDLRQMTGQPTVADLKQIFSHAVARHAAHEPRPRGPVAILTLDDEMYRRACTYASLGYGKLTVQVFRDADEADIWLSGATGV